MNLNYGASMFLGPKAALILVTVRLLTNTVSIQANFVIDYLANSAYQAQNFATAENYYQLQVQNNYQDSTALYNLGAAAYQNKNYTEARKCFEKVGATEALTTKKRAEAYFNAGNSSVQLNELEKALEQYKTALKFDPNDQRIKDNYEKLKKILEQQKNNPEKNKPDQADPDQKDQDSKDNNSQENQENSSKQNQDPKSQDSRGQDSKNNSEQKNSEPKDQAGDQKSKDTQVPKENSGSDQKGSAENKPTPVSNSGEQKNNSGPAQPVSASNSEPDQAAKLDPELKELMQAAQANDRAANKQIMQHQMNQSSSKNSADQGNNW